MLDDSSKPGWWQHWGSERKHNEIFKNKETQDISRIPSEKIRSLKNVKFWKQTSIPDCFAKEMSLTVVELQNAWGCPFSFPSGIFVIHPVLCTSLYVVGVCVCVGVYSRSAHPFLLLDPKLLGSAEYAMTYGHLLSRFRCFLMIDQGQGPIRLERVCVRVSACRLLPPSCLVFSHAEPFTSAWTHPHYLLVYLNWKILRNDSLYWIRPIFLCLVFLPL